MFESKDLLYNTTTLEQILQVSTFFLYEDSLLETQSKLQTSLKNIPLTRNFGHPYQLTPFLFLKCVTMAISFG